MSAPAGRLEAAVAAAAIAAALLLSPARLAGATAPPGPTLVLHVASAAGDPADTSAASGPGDGSGAHPFRDVAAAVDAARAAVASGWRVIVDVAPGRYELAETLRLDFPVRLHGANVPQLDEQGWPLGSVEPGSETVLAATACRVENGVALPLAMIGGKDGPGVEDVALTQLTLEGAAGCPVLQAQRAERFRVAANVVRGTPPGRTAAATLGIDVAASSGVVAFNHVSGLQSCGICIGGGTPESPGSVTAIDNRSVGNGAGSLLLGGSAVPVAGRDAGLEARVRHNDLDGGATGFGLRVVAIQPLGPDDEPIGRVTAQVADNRISASRVGIIVDAGFPRRNLRPDGCDTRTYEARIELDLARNTLAGSLARPALVTFTRAQVVMNGAPLRDWQYLHASTFALRDPDGALAAALVDHRVADPFVNGPGNGGTCAADEAAEPLQNTLIYNGAPVPAQP